MRGDFFRLVILLSILLIVFFPFAGLAPLMLLLFVAVCGWIFQLASALFVGEKPADVE